MVKELILKDVKGWVAQVTFRQRFLAGLPRPLMTMSKKIFSMNADTPQLLDKATELLKQQQDATRQLHNLHRRSELSEAQVEEWKTLVQTVQDSVGSFNTEVVPKLHLTPYLLQKLSQEQHADAKEEDEDVQVLEGVVARMKGRAQRGKARGNKMAANAAPDIVSVETTGMFWSCCRIKYLYPGL